MIRAISIHPGRLVAAVDLAGAFPVITAAWRELLKGFFNPYRPERHYMRGPGPKWRERHAASVGRPRLSVKDLVLTALAAVGVLAAVAAGGSAADARSRYVDEHSREVRGSAFDGQWSVLIETERGACDRSYRVGLSIVNGAVTHEGSPYGRVSATGAVRVSLNMGDQQAQGAGRLSRTLGQGVWRGFGQAGACSGRWMAERRD